MFWKALLGGIFGAVGIGAIAASILLGLLYAGKSSGPSHAEVGATATAAFEAGRRAGQADAEKCDVIVGVSFRGGVPAGDKVGVTLKVRSARSGDVYEVSVGSVCTVSSDLESCHPDRGYGIGAPWPYGCS